MKLPAHYSTMVYDCYMQNKKKMPNQRGLNAEATRATRNAVSWAKKGIKAIGDMEAANPGIGFVINKNQKKQLQKFVDKYDTKKFVKAMPMKKGKKP